MFGFSKWLTKPRFLICPATWLCVDVTSFFRGSFARAYHIHAHALSRSPTRTLGDLFFARRFSRRSRVAAISTEPWSNAQNDGRRFRTINRSLPQIFIIYLYCILWLNESRIKLNTIFDNDVSSEFVSDKSNCEIHRDKMKLIKWLFELVKGIRYCVYDA